MLSIVVNKRFAYVGSDLSLGAMKLFRYSLAMSKQDLSLEVKAGDLSGIFDCPVRSLYMNGDNISNELLGLRIDDLPLYKRSEYEKGSFFLKINPQALEKLNEPETYSFSIDKELTLSGVFAMRLYETCMMQLSFNRNKLDLADCPSLLHGYAYASNMMPMVRGAIDNINKATDLSIILEKKTEGQRVNYGMRFKEKKRKAAEVAL